jgi:hypothetical protein
MVTAIYKGPFTVRYHRHGEKEWQINVSTKTLITKEVFITGDILTGFRRGKAIFQGIGTVYYSKNSTKITAKPTVH